LDFLGFAPLSGQDTSHKSGCGVNALATKCVDLLKGLRCHKNRQY
jgi:hypothetical protein